MSCWSQRARELDRRGGQSVSAVLGESSRGDRVSKNRAPVIIAMFSVTCKTLDVMGYQVDVMIDVML
jgi:hypothetical protein